MVADPAPARVSRYRARTSRRPVSSNAGAAPRDVSPLSQPGSVRPRPLEQDVHLLALEADCRINLNQQRLGWSRPGTRVGFGGDDVVHPGERTVAGHSINGGDLECRIELTGRQVHGREEFR